MDAAIYVSNRYPIDNIYFKDDDVGLVFFLFCFVLIVLEPFSLF